MPSEARTSQENGLKRWDVAVALFLFKDSAQANPRPVLVLSDASFNDTHGHVIAAMITTGANTNWPSDHAVLELEPTGLTHPSVVRWKVFTLPLAVVPRKIGTLGPGDRGLLSVKMAGILLG